MALVLKDRVKEVTTTVGTGSIALGGATAGYQAFSTIGNGNTCYYTISSNGSEWEVGIGTYTSSGNTLSRDTILASSNAGSIVTLSAGQKDVYLVYPAEKAIYEEANGDVIIKPGVLTVQGPGVTSYTTLTNSVAQVFANQNDYAQVNVQNQNSGASASGDYVATADNGTATTKFIDMGINSSGYSDAGFTIVGAYGGYLYVHDGDLAVGTATANNIKFFTGDTLAANEKARIVDSTGNFLIGTTSDTGYKLNVNGSAYIDGAATFGSTVLLDADPTLALQAATKQYVDQQTTAALNIHTPARVATTANLNATYTQGGTTFDITTITSNKVLTTSVNHGLAVNDVIWLFSTAGNGLVINYPYFVYSTPALNQLTVSLLYDGAELTTLTNATGLTYATRANAGVGATLTNAGTNAALVIDTKTLNLNDRVLVKNQSTQMQNGVYTVTTVGAPDSPGPGVAWVLTRATDVDTYIPADTSGMSGGDYVYIEEGAQGAGDSFVNTNVGSIAIGYSNITYTQFSGAITYVGGTNIDVTGQTISLTGTVAATNGGTGNNTVTTGDLLYGSGTNTWSKLGIGTSGFALLSNGTNVSWGALDLAGSGVTGVLPEVHGGTNQNSYVVGDTLYASGTNTLAKLSPNTTTTRKYLGQTGTGSAGAAPTWSTIDAGDITSGTLLTTYGGTGLSSYTAGDITYYASGTALSKLGIGTSTHILTSSGTAPQWTNPSTITVGTATTATTATNLAGGALGSLPYQSSSNNTTLLAGNTTTTKNFLVQTGTGSVSAAPAWGTIEVADVPTLNQNTTGSAATLTTPRAIYGNNFNGSADLTQVIASTFGGTGNGFTKFSGPSTAEKTFTLPDATCSILTTNAAVTATQGGTSQSTYTTGDILYASATNTLAKLGIGSTGQVLTVSGGIPAWEAASGGVSSITGTTNQINASSSTGAITLSTPQSIGTSSSVQFGSFGVGTAASGTTGEIRATNNVTAYYTSDKKFKENIKDIPNALDKVNAIGGKLFDWTDAYIQERGGEDGYFVQKSDFGVIAQDVQAVFPEAVRVKPDETLAVDYEKLSALAFAAIKELKAEIDELKNKG